MSENKQQLEPGDEHAIDCAPEDSAEKKQRPWLAVLFGYATRAVKERWSRRSFFRS